MSLRKGLKLFRRKKDRDNIVEEDSSSTISDSLHDSQQILKSPLDFSEDTNESHEMTDERFQELLDESRRWKSDWIDLGREETEVNLWPLLKKETNILKLTNQLHPNQNQLKRLGTEISSIQIIPPAITTLQSIIQSIQDIQNTDNTQFVNQSTTQEDLPCTSSFGENIVSTLSKMQQTEEIKLSICDKMKLPTNVSIDENQEVNQENVDYEEFLTWLKQVPNHELYVRVKKFVSTVNEIIPKESSYEREMQCEELNLLIRNFVKNSMDAIEMETEKKKQYSHFLRKFISVHCYNKIISCLPCYHDKKADYFLDRCHALSKFITFENLGHDNRHTVSQYKEFWDCAIEQLQVMSMYRFVDDKVVCLNNAVNILTRLLETIFKVVGADELMDGICIIVMKAQVPRLKVQLQMMDLFYEECEEKRGVFESVKLRIRGIISFIKSCKYSDFTKLDEMVWIENMGKEGEGLCRQRSASELSSDDEMQNSFISADQVDMIKEEEEDKEEVISVQQSVRSTTSRRPKYGKKTKKIVDGKWKECLDPMPEWVEKERMNDELVKAWKVQRYLFYKKEPETEEEQKRLLEEYRNLVRTVENLLYLLRS